MRFFAFLTTALTLMLGAVAVDNQKSVIITYPDNTPDSVLNQAKKAIIDGGGVITHEYNAIKGFAATVGEKILNSVSALSSEYNAIVEEDQIVTIQV